jgi:hypothetical protein
MHGKLIIQQPPAYDKLINAEVQLQMGDKMMTAKVIKRSIRPDGYTAGEYNDNPMLNSIVYDVEFPDGQVKEYSENMLTNANNDGFTSLLMDAIIDHRKNGATALNKADAYIITQRGQKKMRKTTCGWKLLVKWKDGSEQWIPLKDMKESHPVEVAEFAKAREMADEPSFSWWVPYTLRKRDVILSAIKARIRKTTHKYGIEMPMGIKQCFRVDEKNGNTFWRDAIAKEMLNVGVDFDVLRDTKQAPPGWSKVTGHLAFDVKMDFTRKACWVLDGHLTPDPVGSTYAGVVSRESVRIAFTYAALNGLDVCPANIRNAYL